MAMQRRYLVNEKGRKTGVVLSLAEYKKLLERLEDLEDALELREAMATETEGWRDLREILEEEQREAQDTKGLR